jgi:ABC-type transport system involved in cytochrome bd biosynthesis fused ATPase/permease subunit
MMNIDTATREELMAAIAMDTQIQDLFQDEVMNNLSLTEIRERITDWIIEGDETDESVKS